MWGRMSTIKQSKEERVFENEVRGSGEQAHYCHLHVPIYNHVADSGGIHSLVLANPLALRRTCIFPCVVQVESGCRKTQTWRVHLQQHHRSAPLVSQVTVQGYGNIMAPCRVQEEIDGYEKSRLPPPVGTHPRQP